MLAAAIGLEKAAHNWNLVAFHIILAGLAILIPRFVWYVDIPLFCLLVIVVDKAVNSGTIIVQYKGELINPPNWL